MSKQQLEVSIIDRIKGGELEVLDDLFTDNRNAFISQLVKSYNCPMEEAKDFYVVAVTIFYDNIMMGKLKVLTVKPLSYLLGIGQNLVSEWRRKNKTATLDMELVLVQHIAEEEVLEDQYEQKLKIVISQLEKLGEACKAILELFYFEKRSIPEITKLLNFANVNTTKSRKYKCNKRLKELVRTEWNLETRTEK